MASTERSRFPETINRDGAAPSTEASSKSGGKPAARLEILSVVLARASLPSVVGTEASAMASVVLKAGGGAGGSGGIGLPGSLATGTGFPMLNQTPTPIAGPSTTTDSTIRTSES